MDDVRGDFLEPPHGTTPAAVIENKNKTLRAVNILMRKGILECDLFINIKFNKLSSKGVWLYNLMVHCKMFPTSTSHKPWSQMFYKIE